MRVRRARRSPGQTRARRDLLVERVERAHGLRQGAASVLDHRRDAEERQSPERTSAPRPRWRRSARTAPCRRRSRPSRASRRHENASSSTASNVSAPTSARSSRRIGVGAIGVVQRVGDRHAHVGVTEVGQRGAVAEASRRSGRSTAGGRRRRSARTATPNRWWASISSRPLFISVAESIVILPPIAQVGCAERLLDA